MLLLAGTRPLSATLLVYEPFSYTPGSQVNGQSGGIGFGSNSWEQDPAVNVIQPGSLENGSQLTQGNSLLLDSSSGGSSVLRKFNVINGVSGTTTWASFLLHQTRINPLGLVPGNNALLRLSTGIRELEIGAYSDPLNNNQLTFAMRTYYDTDLVPFSVEKLTFSNVICEVGITYSVVFSIDWEPGAELETVRLYLNPSSTPDESEALITDTVRLGTISGSYQRINTLGLGQSISGNGWIYDEIRIGTTFADVMPVPEPSTAVLVLLALGGMAWRRRAKSV